MTRRVNDEGGQGEHLLVVCLLRRLDRPSLLFPSLRGYRPEWLTKDLVGEIPGADSQFGDRDRHPERTEIPGVKVVRVESGLFFANAEAVRSRILELAGEEGVMAVVLDSESMPYVDITASVMLRALAEELRSRGVTFAMAKEIGQVRDVLRYEGGDEIPLYATVAEAVAAYRTPS